MTWNVSFTSTMPTTSLLLLLSVSFVRKDYMSLYQTHIIARYTIHHCSQVPMHNATTKLRECSTLPNQALTPSMFTQIFFGNFLKINGCRTYTSSREHLIVMNIFGDIIF